MAPADRCEAILDAVSPLVAAAGRDISTREVAAASGVAEGTIFRVFPSKSDLIDAAIRRAIAPAPMVASLSALATPSRAGTATPDRGLHDLVTAIVATLQEHARTSHRLLNLLPSTSETGHDASAHDDVHAARREISETIVTTVEGLLAPYASDLGIPSRAAGSAILTLSFGSMFSSPAPEPAEVAQLILHGISRTD